MYDVVWEGGQGKCVCVCVGKINFAQEVCETKKIQNLNRHNNFKTLYYSIDRLNYTNIRFWVVVTLSSRVLYWDLKKGNVCMMWGGVKRDDRGNMCVLCWVRLILRKRSLWNEENSKFKSISS